MRLRFSKRLSSEEMEGFLEHRGPVPLVYSELGWWPAGSQVPSRYVTCPAVDAESLAQYLVDNIDDALVRRGMRTKLHEGVLYGVVPERLTLKLRVRAPTNDFRIQARDAYELGSVSYQGRQIPHYECSPQAIARGMVAFANRRADPSTVSAALAELGYAAKRPLWDRVLTLS